MKENLWNMVPTQQTINWYEIDLFSIDPVTPTRESLLPWPNQQHQKNKKQIVGVLLLSIKKPHHHECDCILSHFQVT